MNTKSKNKNEELISGDDKHITQDFPGFPHEPSSKENIQNNKNDQKSTQNIEPFLKPGKSTLKDKKNKIGNKSPQTFFIPDGSASAFDATERVADENNSDEDNNDLDFRRDK